MRSDVGEFQRCVERRITSGGFIVTTVGTVGVGLLCRREVFVTFVRVAEGFCFGFRVVREKCRDLLEREGQVKSDLWIFGTRCVLQPVVVVLDIFHCPFTPTTFFSQGDSGSYFYTYR